MIKSGEIIEDDFVRPTRKQKEKKQRKKCTAKQLENLKKARAIAKKNRDEKRRLKEQQKVEQKVEKPIEKNVKFDVVKTEKTIEPKKTAKLTPRDNPVIKKDNPYNINFTDLIKHQLTLSHQKYLVKEHYRHHGQVRKVKQIPKKQIQKKNIVKPQEISKDVTTENIEKKSSTPLTNKPKSINKFFGGMFD